MGDPPFIVELLQTLAKLSVWLPAPIQSNSN